MLITLICIWGLSLTEIFTGIIAIGAVVTAIYSINAFKLTRSQIRYHSLEELTRLSNVQNWRIYDRQIGDNKLPNILPSWENMSERKWAWRTFSLNHLNTMRLIHEGFINNFLSKEDVTSWIEIGKFWFETSESNKECQEILKQLLKPEEGFPKNFRKWICDNEIIQKELFTKDWMDKS